MGMYLDPGYDSFKRAITALIHMGYLGYDPQTGDAFIPNEEVRVVFKKIFFSPGN